MELQSLTSTHRLSAQLHRIVLSRVHGEAADFVSWAIAEVSRGVDATRLAQLIALASRYVRRGTALEPSRDEVVRIGIDRGPNIERWHLLETLRALLVVSHKGASEPSFAALLEQCFRYADEGELCALYRAIPLLPHGDRFVWRVGEGCRSNMRSVFEAVACDSYHPVTFLDDIGWRQLVMKAVFVGAPLNRVLGLKTRLSRELARMALDFVAERRSAGRPIPSQLWLCLGEFDEASARAAGGAVTQ